MKRIFPKLKSESGASMIEVVIASSILLTTLSATFTYLGNATTEVKGRTSVSETSGLESALIGVTRVILENESKTDPCLLSKNIKNEIERRQGSITDGVAMKKFDSNELAEIKSFLGSSINAQWKDAFNYCSSSSPDKGCLVLELKKDGSKTKMRIALATLQQYPFDFATKKNISRSSCDNSKILNDVEAGAGKGLKANYLLLTATKFGDEKKFRIVLKQSTGEILQTSGKTVEISGNSEFDPSRSPSCTLGFCANSIPPDPGKNYSAWAAFPRGASYNASFCRKCERAPDYK